MKAWRPSGRISPPGDRPKDPTRQRAADAHRRLRVDDRSITCSEPGCLSPRNERHQLGVAAGIHVHLYQPSPSLHPRSGQGQRRPDPTGHWNPFRDPGHEYDQLGERRQDSGGALLRVGRASFLEERSHVRPSGQSERGQRICGLLLSARHPGLVLEESRSAAMYGFLAPTGRFRVGANNNVGSGYWTHALSSGQTVYPDGDRRLSLSAFEIYEFHTVQEGTGIHPGQTFSLDYSLLYAAVRTRRFQLQAGPAGYEQRQTTARTGPSISPSVSAERYASMRSDSRCRASSRSGPASESSISRSSRTARRFRDIRSRPSRQSGFRNRP
jgi:hypothetical protein